VGVKNLHKYVTGFGFGKRTGIPLPAESPGQVFEPRKWGKTSIGSVAMGHEITTTTLQLAQAGAVVANHGRLVKPRIVLKRQRHGEPVEYEPVAQPVQVLRPENAARMIDMMQDVVLSGGTGTRAKIEGYNVGGKTGSAQIYDHKLKQYTHKYNASFLGIAPLTDPRVVVVVTLNGSALYGGAVAAPVFKEIASSALRVLDIAHDKEMPLQLAKGTPHHEEEEVVPDLAFAPESPAPFEVADEAEAAAALLAVNVPRAPNVVGKTMRDVLQQTAADGIQLEAKGSGIARSQHPSPGARLHPGERLVVEFRR
jgi:cell division protein FtsI (penicillin-binding protein 3)